jgi:hypothetical protein
VSIITVRHLAEERRNRNVKTPETIWTASYGFRDSDALGKVWGRTAKYCEAMLRSAFAETGRMYANECESERAIKDQLWYVGPFAETAEDVIADMEESARESEFRDDLASSPKGYCY